MSISNETKETVKKIPLLSVKAGPRDGDKYKDRLKEELNALIQVYLCSEMLVCKNKQRK